MSHRPPPAAHRSAPGAQPRGTPGVPHPGNAGAGLGRRACQRPPPTSRAGAHARPRRGQRRHRPAELGPAGARRPFRGLGPPRRPQVGRRRTFAAAPPHRLGGRPPRAPPAHAPLPPGAVPLGRRSIHALRRPAVGGSGPQDLETISLKAHHLLSPTVVSDARLVAGAGKYDAAKFGIRSENPTKKALKPERPFGCGGIVCPSGNVDIYPGCRV
jgi:hypothetical protein